ncbi:MAG: hypothetical protein J7604_12370 [Sporocytophaga sp.]|uniref:hypothetical protein n=1 Tax=Sporocytophaga sp. TaxID=2231183 RepID=UPI001B147044|nr:hypothetical protein [Sporocytophaga sp.]MBO9700999.1 hypothetical protein [Sporocytophaga sp.]
MRKYLFTILLITTIQTSFACSCMFFNSNDAMDGLFNSSDLVIIGHPIQNIDTTYYRSKNPKFIGITILVKVDSVLKGELKSDTIFINQTTNGNCSENFIHNEQYLIFGDQIKTYENLGITDNGFGEDFYEESKTLKFEDRFNMIDTFRKYTDKYYTIYTSGCISFMKDSSIWEYFTRRN